MSNIMVAQIPHLRPVKRCLFATSSLTFTLSVEGGVTATDAAIVVIAGTSLVNAAFLKARQKDRERKRETSAKGLQTDTCHRNANLLLTSHRVIM